MWPRRSSPTSASNARRGYTLTELIVAIALGSAVIVTAAAGYLFASKSWLSDGVRLETQQNLRTSVDVLSRDLRFAGACLPDAGPSNIKPLAGADSGTTDSITVRANVRCAIASATANVAAGATDINVDNVTNFVAPMLAYILHQNTTTGEYVLVVDVNQGAFRLTLDTGTTQAYPVGSSVYGAESQTYAIDTSGSVPLLTVTPSIGAPQPAVSGIDRLNIQYVLDRNCTPGPCDVVDLPANDSEWALVRTVRLDMTARSSRRISPADPDGYYRLGQVIEVKPRNFLF